MATHTYTITPRVQADGTGIVLTAGGTAPGSGAAFAVVVDDTVATSKTQIARELRRLAEFVITDTWPPSL